MHIPGEQRPRGAIGLRHHLGRQLVLYAEHGLLRGACYLRVCRYSVHELPATESSSSFAVSWIGTDAGVGLAFYTIYVSTDGGSFTTWQTQTAATSAIFSGAAGHSYGFYSIATDLLGNKEGPKTAAEATTKVAGGMPAATPNFSPGGGVYSSSQKVAISDSTSSATIYYTRNGNLPTTQSTVYTGPVSVASTETLKAIAVASGYSQSAIATAAYTITPASVAAPTFSPAGGTFTSPQIVSLADMTGGAAIYYTTDGTTPTANSALYAQPIQVVSRNYSSDRDRKCHFKSSCECYLHHHHRPVFND